jgi:hypothetical protein
MPGSPALYYLTDRTAHLSTTAMRIRAMIRCAATLCPAKTGWPFLLSVAFFLVIASTPLGPHEVQAGSLPWHAGNFRTLEAKYGDLVTLMQKLPHPNSNNYGKLSSTRQVNFNIFLEALFAAIDASLADGATGDWCGVKTKAATASYAINRWYDTASGRWFIYAYDTTQFGQAYIFINPFAKRNVVIEVPHEDFESGTKTQGARLFKALAARALVINKQHRCADPDSSDCTGTTTVCNSTGSSEPEPFRESDVAHHTANTFQLLHMRYTDMDPVTKFVQLHGFEGSHSDMVEIGDGTTNDVSPYSVSVLFANHLRKYVPAPGAVQSCQESVGDPPSGLCGASNVQGRYTDNPGGDACQTYTSTYSGRFLHVEQTEPLRNEDPGDGWDWSDIRNALLDTWPDCNMNDGASDCSLGPPQSQDATLPCP